MRNKPERNDTFDGQKYEIFIQCGDISTLILLEQFNLEILQDVLILRKTHATIHATEATYNVLYVEKDQIGCLKNRIPSRYTST